jgi:hypothetical protein
MKPISLQELSFVTGGKGGAILGGLAKAGGAALQAAPGILQGVAGIVGAAKSGGGGGGGAAPEGAGGPPPPAAMAGGAGPAGPMPAPSTGASSADGLTKITNNVSIS